MPEVVPELQAYLGTHASVGISSGSPWRRSGVRITGAIVVPLWKLARWRRIRHNEVLTAVLWGTWPIRLIGGQPASPVRPDLLPIRQPPPPVYDLPEALP